MITPEERESIVNEAVEKAIRLTPDLARQMVIQRVTEDKMKLAFLEKLIGEDERYKKWNEVIKMVVEKKEANNPGNLKKALEESLPEIKLRVAQMEGMNFKDIKKPSDLHFKGDIEESPNGAL